METAKMPHTDQWIKKVWNLYTMFHSAINKNEISSVAGKWRELENIILNKVGHVQKAKYCLYSLICGIQT
jgi:hypothetical protein